MANLKQNWWKPFVAFTVLTALFVTGSLLVLAPHKASADTLLPDQVMVCYDTFNAKEIVFKDLNAADQDLYNTCVNNKGGCTVGQPGKAANSHVMNCASPSGTTTASGSGQPTNNTGNNNPNNGTGTNTDDTSGTNEQFECGTKWYQGSFVICPIYWMINGLVGQLDDMINSLLTVDQNKIFDTSTDTGKGYYKAWQTFRAFALALIAIAGLVMIIAHALGFEMLDAYTIKKIVPRLLLAVIAITLSWQLMKFFVIFTNDVGLGVRNIIYAPFQNMPGALTLGGGAKFVAALFGLGAVIALEPMGLLSLAATALLAIGVAFLVLMIRQLVIIVLILFAPIAIACSILPNTHSAYKLWHESFTKALLMFPIIAAFIAVGRVFAVIAIQGNVGSLGFVNQLIGFAAYFLPYFLIPMTFSMAGGAMRAIGGRINDANRGGFDRLKKYRQGKVAYNANRLQTGERFNNKSLNALTARATTSRFGLGRRGREAWDAKMSLAAGEFAQSNHAKAIMFKDPVLQAMTYSNAKEAEARLAMDFGMTNAEERRDAIAGVMASGGFGKARQVWSTKQLAAVGTGYDDEATMLATIARVSGGNKNVASSLWGEMRGTSERAGRNDLKAAFGTGTKLLNQVIDNKDGNASVAQVKKNYAKELDDFGVDAARGIDNMSLARNKPKSVENVMRHLTSSAQSHVKVIEELDRSGDTSATALQQRRNAEVGLDQIRAKMQNLEASKTYGSEIVAEAIHGSRNKNAEFGSTEYRKPGISTMGETVTRAQQSNQQTAPRAHEEEHMQRQYIDPDRLPGNTNEEEK